MYLITYSPEKDVLQRHSHEKKRKKKKEKRRCHYYYHYKRELLIFPEKLEFKLKVKKILTYFHPLIPNARCGLTFHQFLRHIWPMWWKGQDVALLQ